MKDTMTYTHWLVTKGKNRYSVGKHGLVPIVLVPQSVGLKELTRLVRIEVNKRICVFLDDDVASIDVLRASTRPYVVDLVSNLWLSDVRLERYADMASGKEDYLHWTLATMGRLPPTWQGPADGVILSNAPVTINDVTVEPTPFRIIDD